MTKQDVIKNAYGEYWEQVKDYVDGNGFLPYDYKHVTFNVLIKYADCETQRTHSGKWRPSSLAGIENNNGWINIESEADLPKFEGEYYCKTTFTLLDEVKTYSFPNYKFTLEVNNNWWLKYVTHYQAIIKPKNPIY